jgi:carboxyl-terminal processing protease
MNKDVSNSKIQQLTGEYTGIGAMITRKEDKVVLKSLQNFPADKAGFKAGDEILTN